MWYLEIRISVPHFVCTLRNKVCYSISEVWRSVGKKRLKGIVHPKMKILPLITHPHVVSNRETSVHRTQIKIFLMESESSQTLHIQQGSLHDQGPENVARRSVKIIHVTSGVQTVILRSYENTFCSFMLEALYNELCPCVFACMIL